MNTSHIYDCIIIGGGASGLMCGAAFTRPVDGLILEGSPRLGTKLLMAGGGHCNVTHAGTIKDFLTHYGETGKRYRKSLYRFSNNFMIDFLESHGVPVTTDEDGRVLPASDKASDILNLYTSLCQNNNFHIHTDSRVTAITPLIDGNAVSIREAMELSDKMLNSAPAATCASAVATDADAGSGAVAGTETGADAETASTSAGADAGSGAGADGVTAADAGVGARSDARADGVAAADAGVGARSGAGADGIAAAGAGVGARSGAGADGIAVAGAGVGAGSGAVAGTEAGADAETASTSAVVADADAGADGIAAADAGVGAVSGTGADGIAAADAGVGAVSGAGADRIAAAGAGVGAVSGAGADRIAAAGAGVGAGSGAVAGTEAGADAETASTSAVVADADGIAAADAGVGAVSGTGADGIAAADAGVGAVSGAGADRIAAAGAGVGAVSGAGADRIAAAGAGVGAVSGAAQQRLTWQVETESGGCYIARNIVIATGGCSYPKTGSDGSMHEIMKRDLALNITELTPALAPIKLQDYPYTELAGITLQNVEITIWPPQGKAVKNTGPLLFTHTALSGPVALNISRYALPGGRISLNYVKSQRYEDVLQKLQNAMNQSSQDPANIVSREFDLPKRIARLLTSRSLGKDGKSISVKKLAQNLTGDTFTINGTDGFQVAMVTRGGVERSQSDPGTMRLAHRAGCFAIGEALDVDGETGGYNLQFAFSSAFTAARAIEESL